MYRSVNTKDALKNLQVIPGTLVDCRELKTTYKYYFNGQTYATNDTTVIQSLVSLTGKWVGIAGRNVYDPTADSGGAITSDRSNRPPNYSGYTVDALYNKVSFEGEKVFCKELRTTYQYFSNFPNLAIDGTTILGSATSGDARWVSVSGKYVFTSIENYFAKGNAEGLISIAPPSNIVSPTSVASQIQNPILVFYQEFPKGGGYANTYTVTGIDNGSLSAAFASGQIVTAKPVSVVFPDGKPVYDNLFPRTQSHRLTATIDMAGIVTLSGTPYSGYSQPIRIYFFYSLASNEILYSYRRDDIVSDMELTNNLFAEDIQTANALSLFPGSVTNVEDALNHLQALINTLGASTAAREKFITLLSQTVFVLAQTPVSIYDGFEVEYNGTELVEGDDFTVSGNTVTLVPGWGPSIQAGDKIVISYKY